MRWTTHKRTPIYRSEWVELWLDDVEVPGGQRFEHHVLRFPKHSNVAVVARDGEVLLIWRHRFITDSWGWEVPGGWSEPGEDPQTTIRREIEEETGWRADSVRKLLDYNAISGIGDMHFSLFVARGAERVGAPQDVSETDRAEWKSLTEVRKLLDSGHITDGPSVTALSYYLAVEASGSPPI
jgi:8-oxo-dGTP pyrophosphatase MutT (NUDIX family)